jgi:carbon-monoxide dehydrogenase medium subunit
LRRRELNPAVLLSIGRLPGLGADRDEGTMAGGSGPGGPLTLGALTRHTQIAGSARINRDYRAISGAGSQIGGWQTQAIGTLVGNIVNASPAADLVPPLLVHGATVQLRSVRGEREVPLQEFIIDRRKTVRRPEEMVTAISLEPVSDATADEFVKVGRRGAMEVSIVAVAVRITLDPGSGVVTDARIAVGSCGPVAYRATAAEQVLTGAVPDRAVLASAGLAAAEPASPIDDVRGSRAYRMRVLPKVVERALADSVGRVRRRREGAA